MEDKLIEYTDKIVEALEAGVDFAGEQAPLLIQEVLQYYLILNSIWGIICTIMFIIFGYFTFRLFREDEESAFFAFVFTSINLVAACVFWTTVIKISIAPRLFLIEKLSELL